MIPFPKIMRAVMILSLVTELITTPEQRQRWTQDADWRHYASKYTD